MVKKYWESKKKQSRQKSTLFLEFLLQYNSVEKSLYEFNIFGSFSRLIKFKKIQSQNNNHHSKNYFRV